MKAIGLYQYLPISDENSLEDLELDYPKAQGRDILVEVQAISVNPVDTKVRAPKDKVEVETEPKVLGWDAAGVVVEVGDRVTRFKPGDEVFYAGDITRPGSNSQFHLVDERIVGNKPSSLDFAQAAALPLTSITAWEALFDRLKVSETGDDAGKSILIIGGAGGVGSIAIQLAKQVAKLEVIATASRPESITWCAELGADAIANHHDLTHELNRLGHPTVDYIFCCNNTDMHWPSMTQAIKPQGTICSIVENKNPLDLAPLKSKSAGFIWEFMFTRSMHQTEDMAQQGILLNTVALLVNAGTIETTCKEVVKPINATNLRAVHGRIEQGTSIGKIVLSGW